MRLSSVILALVIALPPSLAAQDSPGPRFYIAGGVELAALLHRPTLYAQGYSAPGFSLQGGYLRQFDRLGLRLGLAYYQREREVSQEAFGTFPGFHSRTSSRTLAATFDVTYDLTRGSFRPYAIGGGALYRSAVWSTRLEDSSRVHGNFWGVALAPGLGLRFPLGKARVFTEARFNVFGGQSHVFLPLTFGLRF